MISNPKADPEAALTIQVQQWIVEAAERAQEPSLVEAPWEWNNRITTCLGQVRFVKDPDGYQPPGFAQPIKMWIEYSGKFWPHLDDEKRWDTVIHELSHFYAIMRHGKGATKAKAHGGPWKSAMWHLGGISNPNPVCADKDVLEILKKVSPRRKQVGGECECSYWWLAANFAFVDKWGRVQRCALCKTVVEPTGTYRYTRGGPKWERQLKNEVKEYA